MKLVLVAVVLLAAACSGDAAPTTLAPTTTAVTAAPTTTTSTSSTTSTTTTTSQPPTTTLVAEPVRLPDPIADWPGGFVDLDEQRLLVAIADTPERRRQGLMNVADLLDLDGMLFVFSNDTATGFWMKDTLIALDIAFFDADGAYVDGFEMTPCTEDPCRTYFPAGSYRFALEMEAGTMPDNPQRLAWSSVEF